MSMANINFKKSSINVIYIDLIYFVLFNLRIKRRADCKEKSKPRIKIIK